MYIKISHVTWTFVLQIAYSGGVYRTRTIYNSLRPVWGETFVFAENPSLLTRR